MKRNPTLVMVAVAAMYVIQIVTKVGVGRYIRSPMIEGDGWHMVSDLFAALIVIGMIRLSKVKPSESFPFGLKMVESLGEFAVGLSMFWLAFSVGREALTGLFGHDHSSVRIGRPYLSLALGATAGNAAFSWAVGRWQTSVGKSSGHVSMIADGQETISDARIGVATALGVVGEYLFHAPWLEYPFALGVAILIVKTGGEIFLRGLGSLMKRSLGAEFNAKIREAAVSVRGVVGVEDLRTFRSGGDAVCNIKIASRAPNCAHIDLKNEITNRVHERLKGDFPKTWLFVRFVLPETPRRRVAVAIREEGGRLSVAASHLVATRFLICDVEDGEIVRRKDAPAAPDILKLLREKRVTALYAHDRSALEPPKLLLGSDIEIRNLASADLSALGLP